MNLQARCIVAVIFSLAGSLCVNAQKAGIASDSPIDLAHLSPADSALLELYKDSFQNDLNTFLEVFKTPKLLKIDTTVYNMDRSSHAEVGLGFVSRIIVNGRDEGINGVGFCPSVAYFHKYGFFGGLSLFFYTDKAISGEAPVPAIVPAAGFQRIFFKRWIVEAAYARTFITYGSVESRNLLNNDFLFSTSVDIWKKLIITASGYIDWSSLHQKRMPAFEKRSYEIPISLRKDFVIYKFLGAKVFTISPAITAYFATDNFAFIRQRAAAEQKNTTLSIYTTSVDHFFGFVDVEPSLNLNWRIRNLDISVLPALAIPFNEFDYQTSRRIHNPKEYRFYVQVGIKYLGAVKKKKPKK